MKKIYNYIMICMLAFVAVSCSDEETDTQLNPVKSGDEVQFGLSLGNSARTVYGPEDKTNNVFPIYWVDGDKVQIFSPECLEGRRDAEYKVSVDNEKQDYATALTKTGEIGVQWGNSTTANFYSLYPSGEYTLSSDGTKAEGITINYTQTIEVNGSTVKSDMEDCLMYAKKYVDTTSDTYEGVVELQYNPISTVVWVTLEVAVTVSGNDEFTIQSVSLIAPEDTEIAGTFSLDISNGSMGDFSAGSNTVLAQITNPSTGGFHSLTNGEKLSIPLFLAPVKDLNANGMKIQVVANGKTYTKTLNTDQILTPGKIHKVVLPKLAPETTEWDVATWMKNIPRNVYLSEVSIPGSWNSINPDFQTTGTDDATTIANQYAQGVRAFHLDTRWKAKYSTGFIGLGQTVTVLGLGVADGGENGSATSSVWSSGDKYMRGDDVPLVEDIISQLVGYIKNTPEEYMVLVCSFAQESINHQSSNGYWYDEISAICNKSDYSSYIVDGSKVTSSTLVGDVLGKILVIVNMSDAISTTTALPSGSKCLFTYMPSELPSTRFTATDLLANNTDNLWYSGETATQTGVTMANNQAQITSSTGSGIDHDRGYAPTIDQRTTVLNTILNWSKTNYGTDNYAHNRWVYLGLGGYQVSSGGNAGAVSGSYSTIASTYNTWINGKVTEMGTTPSGQTTVVPYYPVGIVLMNYVNDYASTVKNILLLNNKYRLQYDETKPVNYTPTTTPATQSAYDSYSTYGGDVIELN